MQTILVLNSKGGCGKSTIATNLAGYYAADGMKTALMDYDPQRSSLQWLEIRESDRPPIHPLDATRTKTGLTRTWQTAVPPGTRRLIIDAPAGVSGDMLQEMIRRTDVIVVPVAPSAIDIRATARFMRDLLLVGKIRNYHVRVGIVANRVRSASRQYEPLRRFLNSLSIPFITSLSDSENYVIAAETGRGIHEMDPGETARERSQWQPLLHWIAQPDHEPRPHAAPLPLNAVNDAWG